MHVNHIVDSNNKESGQDLHIEVSMLRITKILRNTNIFLSLI